MTIGRGRTARPGQTPGTGTNDNAAAGDVGEYVSATGGSTSLTTATVVNLTSIPLTAGDWDVVGTVSFLAVATTVITRCTAGVDLTNSGTGALGSNIIIDFGAGVSNAGASIRETTSTPVTRISLAAPATIYLNANAMFSVSTMTATSFLRARRPR